jgi:hypothetical protein
MKTKTYFALRVDIWDAKGENIVEHVAGVDDLDVAEAAYRSLCTLAEGTAVGGQ